VCPISALEAEIAGGDSAKFGSVADHFLGLTSSRGRRPTSANAATGREGLTAPLLAELFTEPFEVTSAKKFAGMIGDSFSPSPFCFVFLFYYCFVSNLHPLAFEPKLSFPVYFLFYIFFFSLKKRAVR
jgi:hypothetical protein